MGKILVAFSYLGICLTKNILVQVLHSIYILRLNFESQKQENAYVTLTKQHCTFML